ncbi:MAG TPA: aspartate--ammonia ligase [Treponemataceae bacterium]|nr:aspartate--ammonia ligase [Treponemataceae bacterium]
MSQLFIPKNYKPFLSIKETEHAIVMIKDFFQLALSTELNLTRVTAPLFVQRGTGLNDDLTGVEQAVAFQVPDMNDVTMEIVHSLAKWKRVKVSDMGFSPGFGLYTDMNAVRADEELDNIHSLYVDQWDWELCIEEKDRTLGFLKKVVSQIYRCLKRTEFYLFDRFSVLEPLLPEEITFVFAEDLRAQYPHLTGKEREDKITEKFGAVFLIGIGADLSDGKPHDSRAPDYDDWSTESTGGHVGLNGDLLVWNPMLQKSLELSSMGIRVSPESLKKQLKLADAEDRKELMFHKRLLNGELSYTIGGGIGQSRLCMLFLRKAHIGETQVSSWPEAMIKKCKDNDIHLL